MLYRILYCIVAVALRFWHPVFQAIGRENIRRGENYVICVNHAGMADPLWALLGMRLDRFPRIMAKQELMDAPVLGAFLKKCNVFGVRRGEHDVSAIKTALKALHDGENLFIFPEGTRTRRLPDGTRVSASKGTPVSGKVGAVIFALRSDTPILPVYVSEKRPPFCKVKCVIGKPYRLPPEDKKAPQETLRRHTDELMANIYALGEQP